MLQNCLRALLQQRRNFGRAAKNIGSSCWGGTVIRRGNFFAPRGCRVIQTLVVLLVSHRIGIVFLARNVHIVSDVAVNLFSFSPLYPPSFKIFTVMRSSPGEFSFFMHLTACPTPAFVHSVTSQIELVLSVVSPCLAFLAYSLV